MGIDFYVCANCGDTFTDCGIWYKCQKCEEALCSECGNIAMDFFGSNESEWYGVGPIKCTVCSAGTIIANLG